MFCFSHSTSRVCSVSPSFVARARRFWSLPAAPLLGLPLSSSILWLVGLRFLTRTVMGDAGTRVPGHVPRCRRAGVKWLELKFRECTCPPFLREAQQFLKHCPSGAGQRPLLASPPALVAVSHSERALTPLASAAHVVWLPTRLGTFVCLVSSACLFKPLPHFCGGLSPFSLTWVVLFTSWPRALCWCSVLHTPSAVLLCFPWLMAPVRHVGSRSRGGLTRRSPLGRSRDQPHPSVLPAVLCVCVHVLFQRDFCFS